MREIKFRAWDKREKRMFNVLAFGNITYRDYPEGGFYDRDDERIGIWVDDETFPERHYIDDFILIQSTGLKDKNGKEIFEGDIVKIGNLLFEVFWREEYATFDVKRGNNLTTSFMISQNDDYEVIGNIHSNPELIKEDTQ